MFGVFCSFIYIYFFDKRNKLNLRNRQNHLLNYLCETSISNPHKSMNFMKLNGIGIKIYDINSFLKILNRLDSFLKKFSSTKSTIFKVDVLDDLLSTSVFMLL